MNESREDLYNRGRDALTILSMATFFGALPFFFIDGWFPKLMGVALLATAALQWQNVHDCLMGLLNTSNDQ